MQAFYSYFAQVSRYHSYLNSAEKILSGYSGEEPFASWLKKFFSANKKYGSRDRRQISNLCYCYFRMRKAAGDLLTGDKILTGLFLCSDEPNEILKNLKPEWNGKTDLSLAEKLSFLDVRLSSVFPWKEELSAGIEYEKFCESFFVQPDLFLRIRPGFAEKVLMKLSHHEIPYEFISPFTLRLPNSFKADKYFELDKEVVVQDYNSQQIAGFIPVKPGRSDRISDRVWDCCAGSGGKSIMAHDLNPVIDLIVSDIRESILANLKKRFERAGIKKYKSVTIDLSKENFQHSIINNQQSIIIADVPCTGSGTWSRTPEQLIFFDKTKIETYSILQQKIISNVIPHLEEGGYLLYITCSVFKKENEDMVSHILKNFNLELVSSQLLKGYDKKADTMFAALLKRSL